VEYVEKAAGFWQDRGQAIMNDHGDYELDPFDEQDAVDLGDDFLAPHARRRKWWIVVLAVLAVVAVGWGLWKLIWDRPPEPEPQEARAPQQETPSLEPVEPEPADLPLLAESDGWVRDVVGQLSEHPRLLTWLLNDDLIRRLVAAVDNMAEGVSPRSHVGFLRPSETFAAVEQGDRLIVDPKTYERYDPLAGVIGSLHVDGTAQVYRNVKPLLDAAYRDLCYPDGDFDAVATKVVRMVLATPVVYDIEVERFASSYKYTDPRLEGLNEAQKHLLRLGPDNLAAVQSQMRRIAARAGLRVD
jgi:hypothetical protein